MRGQEPETLRTNKTNTIRGCWENYRLHAALNGVHLRVEGSVRSVFQAHTDIPGRRTPPPNQLTITLETRVLNVALKGAAAHQACRLSARSASGEGTAAKQTC